MRKESRFWRSKIRGWAASLVIASTPLLFNLSGAMAGEGYFIGDDNAVLPSASDLQVAPKAAYQQPVYQQSACESCDTGCKSCCDAAEPFRLFGKWNECRDWQITGHINGGATANRRPVNSRYNGPVSFNDRNEGTMNQLNVTMAKAIDTSENSWDIGGQVDIMYGSDYIFNQSVGFETHDDGSAHWNGNPYYGLAIPQIYAEIGYNDLSVKLGRFYTILGYEVVPSTGNFFYSHAYTMQYAEPFFHWGGLATYKYSDSTSIIGGIVNGWDSLDRGEDTIAGIGGITWDGGNGLSVALTGIVGNEPSAAGAGFDDFGQRLTYSLVITKEINEKWTYVFQHDYGVQENGNAYKPGGIGSGVANDAEWYGVNQYLFYTVNSCWKAGTRFEWFRDDDGFRVAGVRPGNPAAGGYAGNFYEVTFGLNWTPTSNITVRPELRYDWYDSGNFATALPYNDGADADQFLAAFDVVYIW